MRRIFVLQTITFFLLVAAIALSFTQVLENRRLAREGQQAHRALCVLKTDLARRIKDGHAFLLEHPDGIPGISAKTIQASIANQEATLSALQVVRSCPPTRKDK